MFTLYIRNDSCGGNFRDHLHNIHSRGNVFYLHVSYYIYYDEFKYKALSIIYNKHGYIMYELSPI